MQAPRAKRPLMTALSSAALGNGFAGYGVSSILILYLYESVAKGGLGVDKILSAQILSVYSSLGFIAGIIGSNVADRLIGTRLAYRLGMITKGSPSRYWRFPTAACQLSSSVSLRNYSPPASWGKA
ncbi:hypothetical protein [Lacticaseibacillus nasuensis]|uniref:hypothetical protein n=1 Tax=Lacticaseibacillus nasuensis TaxID=944671 RepID=UPI0006D1D3C1|nr:hypothetical protein [Lacticaseibacillus nasuensis]